MDRINDLHNKKKVLENEIKNLEKEIHQEHHRKINSIWGDKLQKVEKSVLDMIENQEISPYLGGDKQFAYLDILKGVSSKIFDYRLNVSDTIKILEKHLKMMEGYHPQVDPNKNQR